MRFGTSAWPAPWAFGIFVLPLGIYLGLLSTAFPFLLARASVSVDRIAEISSHLTVPWICYFLWSPLADTVFRRRTWLIVSATATALCVGAALISVGSAHIEPAVVFALVGAISAALVLATCGGLMLTVLPAAQQTKASAWTEAGKLCGSALGGAAIIWLGSHANLYLAGIAVCSLVALPSLMALTIAEPKPLLSTVPLVSRRAEFLSEVRELFRSRKNVLSILLLASPMGPAAAMALLPAIASKFGLGANEVIWTNGVAGGLVIAMGAISGGWMPTVWTEGRPTRPRAC